MERNERAKRYLVRGRVQGVGFRWFVQQSAVSMKLRGWTRNLDNGDVEVYAVGTLTNSINQLDCSGKVRAFLKYGEWTRAMRCRKKS
ncbi:MAG: acylphosphatase [Bryobacteraceae bacterium]